MDVYNRPIQILIDPTSKGRKQGWTKMLKNIVKISAKNVAR